MAQHLTKSTRKPTAKTIDQMVEKAFYAVANRRQFPIMSLGRIHAAGVVAYHAGDDVQAAVSAACDVHALKAQN
jgi:hypothetical protein